MPRTSSAGSRQELENRVNDLVANGYKIKSQTDTTTRLVKPKKQSVGVHIFLAIFTWGVGNLIYFLVKASSAEDDVSVVFRPLGQGAQSHPAQIPAV